MGLLLSARKLPKDIDVILLLLRVTMGVAFIFHGWPKIQNPFGWLGEASPFPGFLLVLAAIAEVFGGLGLIVGLLTRVAALGIACTMVVAVVFHGVMLGDPFVTTTGGASYEPALVYLLVAILFVVAGPGRFSADNAVFGAK